MEDGLCAIANGALPTPAFGTNVSIDLDSANHAFGSRGTVANGVPKLERFIVADVGGYPMEECDLMTLGGNVPRITFVPNGTGGYTFFTGTR